jgi:hypothetical protein
MSSMVGLVVAGRASLVAVAPASAASEVRVFVTPSGNIR